MNPIYTPFEIARQLKFSLATMAVTNSQLLPRVLEAVKILNEDTPKNVQVIVTGKRTVSVHIDNLNRLTIY